MNKIEGTIVAASRLESGSLHLLAIAEALEHAKAKHPKFADVAVSSLDNKTAADGLAEFRKFLHMVIGEGRSTGVDVLKCELWEAVEAFTRKDYAATMDELAQCGAVVVRMMEAVKELMEGEAMKDKVLKWMLSGLVGASSKAMAAHLCGFPCRGDYPRDPGDFYRCMMLLDAVPEARALLPKMAEVNRYWEALVSRWNEIEAAFRDEQLRPGVFYDAPKTHKLISEIINKAYKAGEEPIK